MSPQERAARAIILRDIWRGRTPYGDASGPWHVGRDLSIWRRFVRGGMDPHELNGALSVMREVEPSVRCLAQLASNRTGPAILSRALEHYRAHGRAPKRARQRGATPGHPAPVSDVLAQLGLSL